MLVGNDIYVLSIAHKNTESAPLSLPFGVLEMVSFSMISYSRKATVKDFPLNIMQNWFLEGVCSLKRFTQCLLFSSCDFFRTLLLALNKETRHVGYLNIIVFLIQVIILNV